MSDGKQLKQVTCVEEGCLGYCWSFEVNAHHGLCPNCYLRLDAEERAILDGKDVPEVVERVITRIEPANRLSTLFDWAWKVGVTLYIVIHHWRGHH